MTSKEIAELAAEAERMSYFFKGKAEAYQEFKQSLIQRIPQPVAAPPVDVTPERSPE